MWTPGELHREVGGRRSRGKTQCEQTKGYVVRAGRREARASHPEVGPMLSGFDGGKGLQKLPWLELLACVAAEENSSTSARVVGPHFRLLGLSGSY